jgi:hypothetical protein
MPVRKMWGGEPTRLLDGGSLLVFQLDRLVL